MRSLTVNVRHWSGIAFLLFFMLCNLLSLQAQQVVSENDGTKFIRLDLDGHSYFSRMLMVNDFKKLSDTKVALSDETGIIYFYTDKANFDNLLQEVNLIVASSEALDRKYDKQQKTEVIQSLVAENGNWLESYALSGQRNTPNDSCHKSQPFCTNTIYTFPAGTNTSSQGGPAYNCLSTQPNPAWYHLKILDPGPISIHMFSTPSVDIDYCLWGPFTDPLLPCPMSNTNGGLTNGKVVSCSYSGSATETAQIPNGQTGQYYILVITNFSNNPCNITFQRSGGTGTTDCTILPPPASSNSPVCVNGTIQLSAASVINASYQWTGPAGFTSSLQNPQITNAQYGNSGEYSMTITVDGQTSAPTTTQVSVIDPPTASISGTASICAGDSAQITINATGLGPFQAAVSAGSGIPMVVHFPQSPYTFWVKPTSTTTYTLSNITNPGCSGQTSGSALVTVRPSPVAAFSAANLCTRLQTQFTDMSAVSSGSITSWAWSFGDGGTSNLQNPQHAYTNAGTFNVGLTVVSNTGCPKSITLPVIVKPTPVVNAGPDKTIPYGTYIQLEGSASGGSGNHTYQWTPADLVDNPAVVDPNTVILSSSTDFTLTATDNENGCETSDGMNVTITGGPLSVTIVANPAQICIGSSTQLNALPSGGSSDYTFTWTSEPAGFNSNLEDVTVSPLVTTTYKLTVFDGFTITEAQKQVVVNYLPVVDLGDDYGIPHGTSTPINATVTGGSSEYPTYHWTPEALFVDPHAVIGQTNNLYQSQNFSLQVTDSKGCVDTDEITITLEGGPLQVNPMAEQSVICLNESTTLRAVPGGGSNNYVSYTWTSIPAGFNSNQPEPMVSPATTTQYKVVVNDGFNSEEGTVTVSVNPLPLIDLIPVDPRVQVIDEHTIGVCVYDTVFLNAGNEGFDYLWSNGAESQIIHIETSGVSFDQQQFQVTVTNPETQCSNSADITANFTFANCSYGIEENGSDNRLKVYPNPSADGVFKVVAEGLDGELQLDIYSPSGMKLASQTMQTMGNHQRETKIDLRHLSNGVYFLRLSGENTMILKRMIISKLNN